MTVTVEQLRDYIGATADDDADIAIDLADALGEVDRVLADAWRPVPDSVRDRIVKDTGQAMYERRTATDTGASQFADFTTGVPVRAARDPLAKSWPTIRRYVTPF